MLGYQIKVSFKPVLVVMIKDETSVTSTAINPIFNELFEALMLLQILRYFMGMPRVSTKKIELNPSTISYISDGLNSVNIPKILTIMTCLLHCMHSNEQICGKGFKPNYNIYSCYCFQCNLIDHITGNFS